jgi:TolB protein
MRFILGLLFLLVSWQASAELEITISQGSKGAQPIAVVPFSDNAGLPTDVAQVIEADLVRSGLFYSLPRGDMLEKPNDPTQVNYANWRAVNMESLVVGSVTRDPSNDNVTVRFYLMDVYRGEQLLGFDMPPTQPSQLRYVAHQIADLIFEKLTGIKGVFNTKIAYVAAEGFGRERKYQLIVSDADGEFPRVVATSRDPLLSPSWSPDRKRLAYAGYDRGAQAIFVHELATGQVSKLTSERGINGSPAWSPDGKSLAVSLSFERNPDIYVVDVATKQRRRLTEHYAIDTEPSWSPDGQSIVFTSDRGGTPQIYRVPATGGDAERLTFQGKQNLRASYSPDAKSLVLVNYDGGSYRIGVLNLESRQLRLVSQGNLDEGPSFAPNGAVIIYARQTATGAELATVTVDGSVRQRLAQAGDVREPAWSPLLK